MEKAAHPGFFLIRHGETDWNREGRLQGQRDTPLNALGRRQAVIAGDTLRRLLEKRGIDPATLAFVTSPLARARDTMALVRGALGPAPGPSSHDERLMELSFGSWEGRTWREIREMDPKGAEARRRDRWGFVPPGGESYAMLNDRVMPWLETLEAFAVVVAHGGVARVLLHAVSGLAKHRAPTAEIPQGRVLVFRDHVAQWV